MPTYTIKLKIFGIHCEPPMGPGNYTMALMYSRAMEYKPQTVWSNFLCWICLYQKTSANPAHFLPWAG